MLIIVSIFLSFTLLILSMYFFSNILISSITGVILFLIISLLFRYLDKARKAYISKLTKENNFIIKARDNLLRSVNHELRAPLSRMKLDVEMLKNEVISISLNEDINYMHSLVDELMEIEKLNVEKLEKNKVNLRQIISDVIGRLNLDLDDLYFDTKKDIYINGDERRLEKLFKNLLENAYKYKGEEANVRVKIQEEKNKVIVTVMNEGASIPSKDIPFIFEPFYRVDKSRETSQGGLGLGLNISREIILAHNGKVQVSSKKNLGTTFKVTLPK